MEVDLRKRSFAEHLVGESGRHRLVALPITVALTTGLFVAMAVSIHDMRSLSLEVLLRWGAASGSVEGEVWRVVTANFTHGGIKHLLGNMVVLYIVGSIVEGAFGSVAFAVIYLVSGTAGVTLAVIVDPDLVFVGASAAVCGCLGVVLIATIRRWTSIEYKARTSVFLRATFVVAYGLIASALMPHVSGVGHIGGLVAGMICGHFVVPKIQRIDDSDRV